MEAISVIRDDFFMEHLKGVPHIESPKRMRAIHDALDDASLAGKWSAVETRKATVDELAMVHSAEHIQRVQKCAQNPITSFDLDTQATEKSYEVALMGVGAVFSLLDCIWGGHTKRGFACIRPPGHHAEPDKPMGFCLFNNVALGARYLLEYYGAKKVMIVDMDVHHGNGTQTAFYDRNEVLFVSLHQFPLYPGTGNFGEVGQGRGEGFTVNVPMGKGYTDRHFGRIIHFLINPLAQAYQPDMILVSCGFDLYMYEKLAGMGVTPEGYALIAWLLVNIAARVCDGRIAFIMEGGYNLRGIRECGLRVLQELCNVSSLSPKKIERSVGSNPLKFHALKRVFEIQKEYWKILP